MLAVLHEAVGVIGSIHPRDIQEVHSEGEVIGWIARFECILTSRTKWYVCPHDGRFTTIDSAQLAHKMLMDVWRAR